MGGALSPPKPRGRSPRRDSESTPTPTLPAFREPQLATLTDNVPRGDGWLFEVKYDGYRCLAAIASSGVRLYSRGGHDWTSQFRTVVDPFRSLTRGTALIDGEVCAIDQQGRTNFSLLKTGIAAGLPLVFFAFDLLEQDGRSLMAIPQIERKRHLEALLGERDAASPLQYSHHIEGHGDEVFAAMCAGGHEGTIAKRADAPYRPGDRGSQWLKVKCIKRQEFVIVGWRGPEDGGEDVPGADPRHL
jgi:bifunctional non-homologous end joining protein LigD